MCARYRSLPVCLYDSVLMTHSHFVSIRIEGEVDGRNKTHVTIVTAVAGLQVRTLSAEVGLHQLFPVWISSYILNKRETVCPRVRLCSMSGCT